MNLEKIKKEKRSEMENKINIIIPIYNVEKYLRQCLDSVYKLDLTNKEIVLVNDGSTDNSLEIAKEYENKYKENTILISQENRGLSGARNTGINNSSGEYIFFIDSDDFIDPVELEKFFVEGLENKQDMYVGNYYEHYDEENVKESIFTNKKKLVNKTGLEMLEYLMENSKYIAVVWRTLYKRSFFEKNNLKFKEKLLHEDELFTLTALTYANKVGTSDKKFYYYRLNNNNSITNNRTKKNYIHIMYILKQLVKLQEINNINHSCLKKYLLSLYWGIVRNGKLKNKELFRKLTKLKCSMKERIKIIVIFIYSLKCEEVKEIDEI